jgi:hypothetical protein
MIITKSSVCVSLWKWGGGVLGKVGGESQILGCTEEIDTGRCTSDTMVPGVAVVRGDLFIATGDALFIVSGETRPKVDGDLGCWSSVWAELLDLAESLGWIREAGLDVEREEYLAVVSSWTASLSDSSWNIQCSHKATKSKLKPCVLLSEK